MDSKVNKTQVNQNKYTKYHISHSHWKYPFYTIIPIVVNVTYIFTELVHILFRGQLKPASW